MVGQWRRNRRRGTLPRVGVALFPGPFCWFRAPQRDREVAGREVNFHSAGLAFC